MEITNVALATKYYINNLKIALVCGIFWCLRYVKWPLGPHTGPVDPTSNKPTPYL